MSNGQGRTTCCYYYADGRSIVYASTHLAGAACPPVPEHGAGLRVARSTTRYDIFRANADGSNLTRLTNTPGYDAEATIAKDGRIVFTSVRDGDMEIYSMNGDGSDVRRLTNLPGPDGGPFFSPDGSKIVFRGRHPQPGAELDDYFSAAEEGDLAADLARALRDGPRRQQPPAGDEARRRQLRAVLHARRQAHHLRVEHEEPEAAATSICSSSTSTAPVSSRSRSADAFDGFPMFSPDGKKLVFASNRNAGKGGRHERVHCGLED